MFSAKDIALWFLLKNNAEIKEHEATNDEYEVYEGITHLKLQKLIYYAQGISLALHDKPLFYEKILAWTHGPVVREVYDEYCYNGRNVINVKIDEQKAKLINEIENNKEASEVLNLTYDNFAIYTAWQLRQMTHSDNSPWDITEKTKGLDTEIDQDLIQDYFKREIVE